MSALHAEQALSRLTDFLRPFMSTVNVCMVDFICDNLFESALPSEGIRRDLGNLTPDEVRNLPKYLLDENLKFARSCPELEAVLEGIRRNSLESLGVLTKPEDLRKEDENSSSILSSFDHFMGEKKMHEVIVMSKLISDLARQRNIEAIVDLGSGKCYLGQVLSNVFGLDVLAIEGSESNVEGARKREKNLEKKWESLFRRAEFRARGEKPPTRGKNWKSKMAKLEETSSEMPTDENVDIEMRQGGRLHNVSQFVTTETDVSDIFGKHVYDTEESSKIEQRPNFGLIGLHTCGNLASNSIRIFQANREADFCMNVGCCYHHLNEKFYRNPYMTKEENDKCNTESGFPLSDQLRNSSFVLGRNARMMAAQPTNRMAVAGEPPSESLFWRSLLQVIFLRLKPDLSFGDQQVGRIAAKSKDFVDYVRKACSKGGIDDSQLSDSEILSLHNDFLNRGIRSKLEAFYQFRSLFSSLIEGLILLDRLAYLRSDKKISAHLVRLFDPVISPRCYAIVAHKNKDI